eukprot:SAG11_NODE_469_length_9207_cov_5.391744_9_plen_171_part_00
MLSKAKYTAPLRFYLSRWCRSSHSPACCQQVDLSRECTSRGSIQCSHVYVACWKRRIRGCSSQHCVQWHTFLGQCSAQRRDRPRSVLKTVRMRWHGCGQSQALMGCYVESVRFDPLHLIALVRSVFNLPLPWAVDLLRRCCDGDATTAAGQIAGIVEFGLITLQVLDDQQ